MFKLLVWLGLAGSVGALCVGIPGKLRGMALRSTIGGPDDDLDNSAGPDVFGAPLGPMPTVSSKINFAKETLNISTDLWVVGAGTMGSLLCKQWKEKFPDSKVVAETRTASRHEDLLAMGIDARVRDARSPDSTHRCAKHVVICFPPSTIKETEQYYTEITDACRLWAGPLGGGHLLYTSSTAVYGDSHGNTVDETFRLDTRTARSTRLIGAEEQVVTRGGDIIRLAGLYDAMRGPHSFWLKAGSVDGNEDGRLNMLHYEDAAGACMAVLLSKLKGSNINAGWYSNSNKDTLVLADQSVFLACDDAPITRVDACAAALASKQFPDASLPTFASKQGQPGKVCDGTWTREKLGWRPRYPSFNGFMRGLGGEKVTEPESMAAQAAQKKSLLWLPGDDDESFL